MTNFLNARCPKCGDTDHLDVAATVWLRLTDDGTDADACDNRDHQYSPKSLCVCGACGHSARLSHFEAAGEEGAQ
jgi:hypothetical protein